jgi:hypothetical protein
MNNTTITKTEVLSKKISLLNDLFDNGRITLSELESLVQDAIETFNGENS